MSYHQLSAFIKLSTGEYPRFEGDIRLEHPEIPEEATWPNFPCPNTYAVVPWEFPPEHNPDTHCAEQLSPVLVDGQWKIQWKVRERTQEELDKEAALIAEFNARQEALAQSMANAPAIEGDSTLEPIPFNLETTVTPFNP